MYLYNDLLKYSLKQDIIKRLEKKISARYIAWVQKKLEGKL